ncbi:MAG: saccharopine dehydrogenase [Bacteroidetes bacterium MED-G20]|nr:MAG: saccharopine dehydrogenase [Bacteroidetes bacterium MED-G20]
MSNIIVLGAGMVGSAMAKDLSKVHKVLLTDLNYEVLLKTKEEFPKIEILQLDVNNDESLNKVLEGKDVVLSAVPGFLGYKTLEKIIINKKNVVDISFFPENALELNQLARENNVTAIVDCGVAPGMGNVILGYHNETHKLESFNCLVGGLPKQKKWPFCYKAPFSPVDVIEEYTRPARYVENGNIVVRPPLTDCELIEFEKIGTLEAFNSDGLRSIIFTMPHIKNMKEKTLRYPGHVEYIRVLKESGFFSDQIINDLNISVLDFTSKVLFKEWKLDPLEEEFTVMRITLEGYNENGNKEKIIYNLFDEFSQKTKISSMARTTGYTATAAINLFLDGVFEEKGVFPPELIGRHRSCFNYFMSYLKERNINYEKEVISIS